MSCKDYQLIASVLKQVSDQLEPQSTPDTLRVLMRVLCKELKAYNHSFDEGLFLDACGYYNRSVG